MVFKGALFVSSSLVLHLHFESFFFFLFADDENEDIIKVGEKMTLQLGSAELLFKDTSATDEVSLPYIDDISPRELKAAEVMVKEEVRHFFFNALGPYLSLVPQPIRSFDDLVVLRQKRLYRERYNYCATLTTVFGRSPLP